MRSSGPLKERFVPAACFEQVWTLPALLVQTTQITACALLPLLLLLRCLCSHVCFKKGKFR